MRNPLFHIDCYKDLAVKVIVSAIQANDLPFLRTPFCQELCDLAGLGVTGNQMADKLGHMERINWQQRPEAVLKALQNA